MECVLPGCCSIICVQFPVSSAIQWTISQQPLCFCSISDSQSSLRSWGPPFVIKSTQKRLRGLDCAQFNFFFFLAFFYYYFSPNRTWSNFLKRFNVGMMWNVSWRPGEGVWGIFLKMLPCPGCPPAFVFPGIGSMLCSISDGRVD